MELLKKIAHSIDRLNDGLGRTVAWLTTLLVLLVCAEVVLNLCGRSANWLTELEWHVFALIFLLGAGYALRHDRHVRVDLFYNRFSQKDKALTDLLGSLLFLIPWCITVGYFSFLYAKKAWHINEHSPDPGGLPARYIIKFAIVIGMLLLLLQAVSHTIRAGKAYWSKSTTIEPQLPHPKDIL
ncbi:MAG TPA: TRAP transporter small permease subunit [Saprospiraceae bacterium]|nr:TRAP transporter small permease subunit [Saprospiraceae bacterium]HMP12459.1 TRAP transporter small permease subunit [Saprospiraceae bacterium]